MTTPDRSVEELIAEMVTGYEDIIKSNRLPPVTWFQQCLEEVAQAERQKREEVVKEIVSTLKVARNDAQAQSLTSYGEGVYEGLCHAVSLVDNGIKLTQPNNK